MSAGMLNKFVVGHNPNLSIVQSLQLDAFGIYFLSKVYLYRWIDRRSIPNHLNMSHR